MTTGPAKSQRPCATWRLVASVACCGSGHASLLPRGLASAAAVALCLSSTMALGAADGPDAWDVTGVTSGDRLNVHAKASAASPVIGGLAHDARNIRNRGCTGLPTFAEWSRMESRERARAAHARWCRIEHDDKTGWVAGRFLKEAAGPAGAAGVIHAGAWVVRCGPSCVIEQSAIAASRASLLRIEPRGAENAQISIVRKGVAQSGVLSIYMDGETVSQGPIAPLVTGRSDRLLLSADDITAGLLRKMRRHKNMVLSFPGEERGIEIHLEHFDQAWSAAAGTPR